MSGDLPTVRPAHIAVIMDGNGRWAKRRGLPRLAGHRAGVKTLRKLIEHAVRLSLDTITVYAFSQENWRRPRSEVDSLMALLMDALGSELDDLNNNNVRLGFIGERADLGPKLRASIDQSEAKTRANTGLKLNVAANYSGRWDITRACRALAEAVARGRLRPAEIGEAQIQAGLSLAGCVEPDLFIRTGGEQRVSNYLLWQLAYTELYFTDVLWPDFSPARLDTALDWFAQRQRRFGKTSEQIEQAGGSASC